MQLVGGRRHVVDSMLADGVDNGSSDDGPDSRILRRYDVHDVAMMSMMMRRQRPFGRADALGTEVGTRVGPWRGLATADRPQSSTAFEEYRQEALQRLEQEEGAFRRFLEQLRRAKDKTEFDQFMAQRRGSAAPAS